MLSTNQTPRRPPNVSLTSYQLLDNGEVLLHLCRSVDRGDGTYNCCDRANLTFLIGGSFWRTTFVANGQGGWESPAFRGVPLDRYTLKNDIERMLRFVLFRDLEFIEAFNSAFRQTAKPNTGQGLPPGPSGPVIVWPADADPKIDLQSLAEAQSSVEKWTADSDDRYSHSNLTELFGGSVDVESSAATDATSGYSA